MLTYSFLNIPLAEWLGYLASVIILVSLMMNSVVRLRWINLAGALLFSTYGFLIGALPVAILNGIIALVDVYYLIRIYTSREYFSVLPVENDARYLNHFLAFHQKEINRYYPSFSFAPHTGTRAFFLLRDATLAGVIITEERKAGTLNILTDYVIPHYRDMKMGHYFYVHYAPTLYEEGIRLLRIESPTPHVNRYLKRLGFYEHGKSFEKILKPKAGYA